MGNYAFFWEIYRRKAGLDEDFGLMSESGFMGFSG